jgi:hypothetical protein
VGKPSHLSSQINVGSETDSTLWRHNFPSSLVEIKNRNVCVSESVQGIAFTKGSGKGGNYEVQSKGRLALEFSAYENFGMICWTLCPCSERIDN